MKKINLKEEIPLLSLIPKTSANRYFYENGHSKLIPRLTLKVHSDIEECFILWDKFSPKQTIFDLWDFRYAWYKGLGFKPYFYTLYEGKKPLAVLPLCYDDEDRRFEWFGCEWIENNSFFVDDKKLIDFLLAIVPTPIYLNSIKDYKGIEKLSQFGNFKKDKDPRNIKDISTMFAMDDYLGKLKKKDRYHLKSDYQRVLSYGARVDVIETKDLGLFEKLESMNTTRFNGISRDISWVAKMSDAFRNIIKNADIYTFKYMKVSVQNKIAAIDMVITYKDIYYQFTGSNDVYRFNGIGQFMTYIEFEDAIRNGFNLVDVLQEDHGWKHRFFDQKELYLLEK